MRRLGHSWRITRNFSIGSIDLPSPPCRNGRPSKMQSRDSAQRSERRSLPCIVATFSRTWIRFGEVISAGFFNRQGPT